MASSREPVAEPVDPESTGSSVAAEPGGDEVPASWDERFAALEARVNQLERAGADAAAAAGARRGAGATYPEKFWALEGLKERVPDGAVLFTGVAPLPTGEHYEWQQATPTDQLLNLDWSEFSGVLAALGHPVRLLLLRHVLGGVRTVAQLQQNESLGTTGQLYHHLRQLVAAGWLKASGRGRYVVPAHRVVPLLVTLAAATPIDHTGPETPVEHSDTTTEGERQG